jgi:hypothetical protein
MSTRAKKAAKKTGGEGTPRGARRPAVRPVTPERGDEATTRRMAPRGNDARRGTITEAMEHIRLNGGPGGKSTAWRMNENTLWQMCCERICDMRDTEAILSDYADEIKEAGVNVSAVRHFMTRVRCEVNRIQHEAWKRLTTASKLKGVTGDPLAASQMLLDRVVVDLVTMIEGGALTDGSVGVRHAVLRGFELVRDTVESLARARLADNRAAQLERTLRAVEEELDRGQRSQTVTPQDIVAAVREVVTGKRAS